MNACYARSGEGGEERGNIKRMNKVGNMKEVPDQHKKKVQILSVHDVCIYKKLSHYVMLCYRFSLQPRKPYISFSYNIIQC